MSLLQRLKDTIATTLRVSADSISEATVNEVMAELAVDHPSAYATQQAADAHSRQCCVANWVVSFWLLAES